MELGILNFYENSFLGNVSVIFQQFPWKLSVLISFHLYLFSRCAFSFINVEWSLINEIHLERASYSWKQKNIYQGLPIHPVVLIR